MGAAELVPSVDAQRFKEGMRRLAGAVCIVALADETRRAGLTATAVCSISAAPPRLLVCINRGVFAHELVAAGRPLCLNVLAPEQIQEAKRFAGMVDGVVGEERFASGAWAQSDGEAPELTSALARFQCRIAEVLPAASHSMVVCDVVGVRVATMAVDAEASALIYFDGRFMSVAEVQTTR